MATTYALVKAMNAGMLTATAIPLYLWARGSSLRPTPCWRWRSSSRFRPSCTRGDPDRERLRACVLLFLFVLALMLERPTVTRQLLALGLAALCVTIRVQAVFLLIIPTASCEGTVTRLLEPALAARPS